MGAELHVVDYVVFAASVLISVAIGAWYARPGAAQQTPEGYLQGDRQLQLIPVIISLCVTYVSAIMMIGVGAEAYYYGVEIMLFIVCFFTGNLMAVTTWVPLLYPLRLTSANQYLRMRYRSHVASLVGMVLQLLSVIMVCGVVLYAPSTLLEAFGGFPTWASLLIVGLCSTFYTSIGGIKGVVFTDVFQAFIMLAGLLIVTIMGFIRVGGFTNGWKIYIDWGRVDLSDFMRPSPFKRLDFFSVILLQPWMWAMGYGLMQASVQRYSSLPTKRAAIKCVLGVMPGSVLFMTLSSLCGVVMFSYYAIEGCDPLAGGRISDVNQLLLQLVMDMLYYPGIPGLFIAAIFCSSLSTLSSQLTAMAAFIWDDLLIMKLDHLSDRKKTLSLKILVGIFGLFSTGIGFLCLYVQGTLIKMVIMFTQAMYVPLGLFFCNGAVLPVLNLKGSLLGCFLASCLVVTMIVGGEIHAVQAQPLPLPISTCANLMGNVTLLNSTLAPTALTNFTSSVLNVTDSLPENTGESEVFFLFRISHYWYGPIGLLSGVFWSLVFCLIPCFQEKVLIPENLIFPFVRCCFKTQKIEEEEIIDTDEIDKMIQHQNKQNAIEDQKHNTSVLEPNYPVLSTPRWMYESPHRGSAVLRTSTAE